MLWRNNISFKLDTEKVVLRKRKERLDRNCSGLKKFLARFYHVSNVLLRDAKYTGKWKGSYQENHGSRFLKKVS